MPTTSTRKARSNRENARFSTGPRTRAGKLASRANAVRHGLCADPEVLASLPGEDPHEFRNLLERLRSELAPDGALEEALTDRAGLALWRLGRASRIEVEMLLQGLGEARIFQRKNLLGQAFLRAETDRILRYERAAERTLSHCLATLAALRDAPRQTNRPPA